MRSLMDVGGSIVRRILGYFVGLIMGIWLGGSMGRRLWRRGLGVLGVGRWRWGWWEMGDATWFKPEGSPQNFTLWKWKN